jgi:hypothetical protein
MFYNTGRWWCYDYLSSRQLVVLSFRQPTQNFFKQAAKKKRPWDIDDPSVLRAGLSKPWLQLLLLAPVMHLVFGLFITCLKFWISFRMTSQQFIDIEFSFKWIKIIFFKCLAQKQNNFQTKSFNTSLLLKLDTLNEIFRYLRHSCRAKDFAHKWDEMKQNSADTE